MTLSKFFYLALGILCIALGGLGIVLPVLPTTPFILLAAVCFARSSPRLHQWLKYRSLFSTIIQNWEATRTIPRRAKRVSLALIAGVGGLSVWMVSHPVMKGGILLLLAIPIIILFTIPTTPDTP